MTWSCYCISVVFPVELQSSFQILISVGTSTLPEAPLISDSPFCKQPQTVQALTGCVVLAEARRTWPGGSVCRKMCSGTVVPQSILVGRGMEMERATHPP